MNWREEEQTAALIREQWQAEQIGTKTVTLPLYTVLGLIQVASCGVATTMGTSNSLAAGIKNSELYAQELATTAMEMECRLNNLIEQITQ